MTHRLKRIKAVIVDLVACAIYGVLAWRIWLVAVAAAQYGDITQQIGILLAPFRFFIAAMCLLCLAVSFAILIADVTSERAETTK
jgi:hypothetical protein